MNIRLTRRELIQKSLAGFGALSLPVALTACGDDNENTAENDQARDNRTDELIVEHALRAHYVADNRDFCQERRESSR